jgi:phage-related minor tail protein
MTDSNDVTVGIDVDTSAFDRALTDLEKRSQSLGAALTSSLRSAALQGKDLESVLQTVALRISAIALSAGLKPLEDLLGNAVAGLTGALGSAFGFAKGGVPGVATPFAEGGVVRSPTFFPTGAGPGLMGEAGSEAILPLARGSDGRLGVSGGGGGVNVTFNVTATDARSFVTSEAEVSAMLLRAVRRGTRGS